MTRDFEDKSSYLTKTICILTLLSGFAQGASAQSGASSTIRLFGLPPRAATPADITPGPDGALWFTGYSGGGSGNIGRITTAGRVTLFPFAAYGGAVGITAGPDGALWFTEQNDNMIGRITTDGIITEYAIPKGSQPQYITTGPDGALWFTLFRPAAIGRVTTEGAIREFPIGSPQAGPEYITKGPDGALWFTEYGASRIGRITLSGAITEFPASGGPYGIATGSDGALWYTEYDNGNVARITTEGAITEYPITAFTNGLLGITAGPDKALWFIDGVGYLSRITTTGTITRFPIPGGGNYPQGISAGPDGDVWFAGYNGGGNEIGRAPACGLGFSASFANGTLSMNFDLGIDQPAVFRINVETPDGNKIPFSEEIPAFVPARSFSMNWDNFPNLGALTVKPQLGTPSGKGLCAEWTTVNTAQ